MVRAERIAYIQEFIDNGRYVCKFWVFCTPISGELTLTNKDADETLLTDAGFFARDDMETMNVSPPILKEAFWVDWADRFSQIRYLGYASY